MVLMLKNPKELIEMVMPFIRAEASPAVTPAAMVISAMGVLMSRLRF